MNGSNRRRFLKTAASGLATASVASAAPAEVSGKKMIGIQVGAVSFVDEGVEQVLDIFQQRAGVNTLFLAVFSYGRGIAGRQVPGQPLPDHGKQEYDTNYHGGNFATVHPQYYRDTGVKPEDTRSPDYGDLDIVATVLPAARKRSIRTILWAEDVWRSDLPGIERLQAVDLHGRKSRRLCFANPYHRNFLSGLMEDYTRSYEIDGIMWCSENSGAFDNALTSEDPGSVGCFCEHCEAKARKDGLVDVGRVRKGYLELEAFLRSSAAGKRPVDGHYVTLWRILFRYPEILAWEQFWHDNLRETYSLIYKKVKSIKPAVLVGWHIKHSLSFSPYYRAQQDIQALSGATDFLKMVMYHNCGGPRMASYIQRLGAGAFADFTHQQLLDFEYRVMNYQERSYEQIPYTGLSGDYVFRETKRCMEGAQGTKILIWPGIDIDIPTGESHSKSTPEGTRDAVLAALRAGAPGVILSRKYSEMKLANLSGAGEALKKLGVA
jgi:hypothetical protein